jgi:hypothetical protein
MAPLATPHSVAVLPAALPAALPGRLIYSAGRRCGRVWSRPAPRRRGWFNGAGRGLDEKVDQREAAGHRADDTDERQEQQARAGAQTRVVSRAALDGVAPGPAGRTHDVSRRSQPRSVTAW